MRSDSATCGSASWAIVNKVCIESSLNHACTVIPAPSLPHPVILASNLSPHPPGVEHALGIEALLDPLRQCGKAGLLRLEHIDGGAQERRSAHQRGVTAERLDRRPN